jgi:hypothetical protein
MNWESVYQFLFPGPINIEDIKYTQVQSSEGEDVNLLGGNREEETSNGAV